MQRKPQCQKVYDRRDNSFSTSILLFLCVVEKMEEQKSFKNNSCLSQVINYYLSLSEKQKEEHIALN